MNIYEQISAYVDQELDTYKALAMKIFAHPETSNHEYYACEQLTALLSENGFQIKQDIAGHPTGFIASYPSKKKGPIIGILCEYDALPKLGHACGHNIYAAVSALSAVSLKQVIDEIGGEVRLFGTPCEEGGENANAKISYVNAGLFQDVDVALSLHPSFYTRVSPPTLAIDGMEVEYFGKASHSSTAPEKGVNALDAGVMCYNGISVLRQQMEDGLRYSAYFTNGGQPGIIPDYCSLHIGVAALSRKQANDAMMKLERIAKAQSEAFGCEVVITKRDRCDDEMILTPLLDERYMYYMEQLDGGNRNYDYHGGLGATDVGNVSHVIPTLHSRLSISNTAISAHTVEFKEAAGSEYGLNQIAKGAKALAFIGVDLIIDATYLEAVKKQHKENCEELA